LSEISCGDRHSVYFVEHGISDVMYTKFTTVYWQRWLKTLSSCMCSTTVASPADNEC